MPSQFTQRLAAAPPKFDFVAAHFECERDRYGKNKPHGIVNLGSAQNFMHGELLHRRLRMVDCWAIDAHYQSFGGTLDCRMSVAGYLQTLSNTNVNPDAIVVGNGIISLLESLAVALLDDDDSVLIPTPVFPGLVAAMSVRVRSKVAFLHTTSATGFQLTPELVDAELHRRRRDGHRIRAILLCSPGNPVGQVFTADEIEAFADIAQSHDCALILDEVYAGSVFEDEMFASGVALKGDHIYVLGGLSKDFGLAGHATGWLFGRNQAVMNAVAKQAHFFRLPAPTQRVISSLLEPDWRSPYLQMHRDKLTRAYLSAKRTLNDAGIEVIAAQAGLCLWLDLRNHLSTHDAAGELELYHQLLKQHRVHVSPGAGFRAQEPGFFRICFSQDDETRVEGLSRLTQRLASIIS